MLNRRTFMAGSVAVFAAGCGNPGRSEGDGALPLRPDGAPNPSDGDREPDDGDEDREPGDGDGAEPLALSIDPTALPESSEFPLGVQAGAVTAQQVLLWVWAPNLAGALHVRVWPVDAPLVEDLGSTETALTPSEGYVKVTVDGLSPSTDYAYAFCVAEDDAFTKRSPMGRFRSAPADDDAPVVTLGAYTCTKHTYAPFEALALGATLDVDFNVHLGDMSYNDGAVSLDAYRTKWRAALNDSGYRALLPAAAMYATWDDHEVDNNWDPETLPAAHVAAAKQAFFETLAVAQGPNDRLWTSYRWGRTLELFVLDCRSERKPSTRTSAHPIYIGVEQMAWLKQRLVESPCHFKVLLNSVPMTKMSLVWAPAKKERWEGYEAQREELLDHLEAHDVDNVWFLSGDFHTGFVARLEASGFRKRLWEIAVGPSGNPLGLGAAAGNPGSITYDAIFPPAQFRYGSSKLAVTTVRFDPHLDTVEVVFLAASDGAELYRETLSRSA